MSKMSRKELEKIVSRDMHGFRLGHTRQPSDTRDVDAKPSAPIEASTPPLHDLKQKYLRDKYRAPDTTIADNLTTAEGTDTDSVDDDQIVAVEPETATHPWDRAARPKAVVVSGRDKKIIGKQG